MELPKEVEQLIIANVPEPSLPASENPLVKWLKELLAQLEN